MLTPDIGEEALDTLASLLLSLPRLTPICETPPAPARHERRMSAREAMLAPSEWISTEASLGRTLAAVTVGCPPAVPILMMGEYIDQSAIDAFRYYGIDKLLVVRE